MPIPIDPESPQPSVTAAQARRAAIVLTAVVSIGALSIDMFLPSLPSMARDFGASAAASQLTVTLFLAANALAQLLLGPLSDRLGRRPVLLGAMALYTLAGWACWLAPGMPTLIAARIAQAFGAAGGPVLGRAIVRDIYGQQRSAKILAYIGTAQVLTPILAPVLGGWLHAAFGWHSVFLTLAACGVVFGALVYMLVPESLHTRDPLALNPARLIGNARALVSNPVYLSYVLVVTLSFGGQFAFISASSYVLIAVIGVSPTVFGYCFAAVAVGIMTGSFAAGRLVRRLSINPLILAGTLACSVSGVVLAVLALAGVSSLWAIVLPMFGYAVGVGLVMPTSFAGAVGPYPHMAGLASAVLGFLMLTGSAGYGMATGSLFDGTARPMACAIAVAGLASLAAFWLLNRGRPER